METTIVKSEYWNGGWIDSTGKTSYVGTNYSDYYTYALHFTAPEFQGISKGVRALLGMTAGGDKRTVTLRWALCSSDANKDQYLNTNAEVNDANQLASGVFTAEQLSSTATFHAVEVVTEKLKPGQAYTLFIWGYASPADPEWACILNAGYHDVSVEVLGGIIRVVVNGEVRTATVVVKHGGQLRTCMAGTIHDGSFTPGA